MISKALQKTVENRMHGKQTTLENTKYSKYQKWTSCILDIQEKTRKQRSR